MSTPMSAGNVFLSYSRLDGSAADELRTLLAARGITTFLDRRNLVAGTPWPQALEEALTSARAIAVLIGPHGLGLWQRREMYFALDLQARAEQAGRILPVVPIILPEADIRAGFLFLNTWVDAREGFEAPGILDQLLGAFTSGDLREKPAALLDVPPYRDLRTFREEDAGFFFGREDVIQSLWEKVRAASIRKEQPHLTAVVGQSGSGKSSVVMAGLLPLLRRQRPPDPVWDIVSFTPDKNPWRRMADALLPLLEPDLSEVDSMVEAGKLAAAWQSGAAELSSTVERILKKSNGTDRLLVVVDQFEELFTLAPEGERKPFVDALLAASTNSPLSILLTLRSDYYGRAIEINRLLSDVLPESQVNVGAMRPEQLEAAILKPAGRVGLAFEPDLVPQILKDVGREPGNLALLEFALTELWNRRQGAQLTRKGYNDSGGVEGAIARRADRLVADLPKNEQVLARKLLTRVVQVARGGEEGADARRRSTRSEVGEEAWRLAQLFAAPDARLLVINTDRETGAETVEVAHEALIRKWETLKNWLDEDRKFLVWRQELAYPMKCWLDAEKHGHGLLWGPRLAEAEGWVALKRDEFNAEELEFLTSSLRANRTTSLLKWVALAAVIAVVFIATGFFFYSRTDLYQIGRILATNPEELIFKTQPPADTVDLDPVIALIYLNRFPQLRKAAESPKEAKQKCSRLVYLLAALYSAGKDSDAALLQGEVENEINQLKPPDSTDLRLNQARLYIKAGKVLLAQKVLNGVVANASGSNFTVDDYVRMAKLARDLHEPKQVDVLLTKAATAAIADPDSDSLITVADAYTDLGDPKQATALLNMASQIISADHNSKSRQRALNSLAAAQARNGQIDDARNTLKQLEDPGDGADTLAEITKQLISKDDVDGALKNAKLIDELAMDAQVAACQSIIRWRIEHNQADIAVQFAIDSPDVANADCLVFTVKRLAAARNFTGAEKALKHIDESEKWQKAEAIIALTAAYADNNEADKTKGLLKEAEGLANTFLRNNIFRINILMDISMVYAGMKSYREARAMADNVLSQDRQILAYDAILISYTAKKGAPLKANCQSLLKIFFFNGDKD